ncbi:response regulator [Candidatus Formimonas warabiya]|uniref:Stage 0 sporulation protein A homolog n=1 Tax=Formimonas warabiya TaxID=1761012 RepID=A0A3G1KU73_FORW1|nr:response regulator [Candidatus Formimonas warabiya]ATW26002.1 two-component system response regulator [Candidatus Formimonas warabiya]
MGTTPKENWSILIVDDQLGVRRLLFEALKDEFMAVYTAGSGIEAIEQVQECNPDLVVMDMKMPRMNGLEVLKTLRQMKYDNPVIMMTAYGELEIVSEAAKMGVKKHITKPFDLKELRVLIKETLKETSIA